MVLYSFVIMFPVPALVNNISKNVAVVNVKVANKIKKWVALGQRLPRGLLVSSSRNSEEL